MQIVCLDLEGVLVPEVWIELAKRTGIEELKLTTRDIKDYDELMARRLKIMDEHGLKIADIQAAIDTIGPMDGALDFVRWLDERFQLVILSDTFYEFAEPLMRQLDWPTLFCHKLTIDANGRVSDYNLRMKDHKTQAVKAFHELNFKVMAAGDSYNDTGMLLEADFGTFFKAPDNCLADFPQLGHQTHYEGLKTAFLEAAEKL